MARSRDIAHESIAPASNREKRQKAALFAWRVTRCVTSCVTLGKHKGNAKGNTKVTQELHKGNTTPLYTLYNKEKRYKTLDIDIHIGGACGAVGVWGEIKKVHPTFRVMRQSCSE